MPKPRQALSEQLRSAVRHSGKTVYRLSLETGISQSVLSRFMRKKTGLNMQAVDDLTRYFDLSLYPHDRSE